MQLHIYNFNTVWFYVRIYGVPIQIEHFRPLWYIAAVYYNQFFALGIIGAVCVDVAACPRPEAAFTARGPREAAVQEPCNLRGELEA